LRSPREGRLITEQTLVMQTGGTLPQADRQCDSKSLLSPSNIVTTHTHEPPGTCTISLPLYAIRVDRDYVDAIYQGDLSPCRSFLHGNTGRGIARIGDSLSEFELPLERKVWQHREHWIHLNKERVDEMKVLHFELKFTRSDAGMSFSA
jgi:hypothetical protein